MVLAAIFFGGAAIVLEALWSGFVLSVMWKWFIAGAFGLPQIGVAQAIGVSLVVGMLTHQRPRGDGDDDFGEAIAYGLLAPLVVLVAGWIVKAAL
jgi:hypothetical protein